jgi:hypothetical protein
VLGTYSQRTVNDHIKLIVKQAASQGSQSARNTGNKTDFKAHQLLASCDQHKGNIFMLKNSANHKNQELCNESRVNQILTSKYTYSYLCKIFKTPLRSTHWHGIDVRYNAHITKADTHI